MNPQSPLLFLVFNRPETTERVFAAIRQARPTRLYIAADGPRPDKEGEAEQVRRVREIVTAVDWDCRVRTLFRDHNLGCKMAVSGAISWFFEQEEEGIILEDDCLPNQSFFAFCSKMLAQYRDDTRIMMVSGTNYLFEEFPENQVYFFSRYFAIWGWATWKRAWRKYDPDIGSWPAYKNSRYLDSIFGEPAVARYFAGIFDQVTNKRIDTWDLQWVYCCLINYGLSIVPTRNLVANIGFAGTHTDGKVSKFFNMPMYKLDLINVGVCDNVAPDPVLDRICFKNIGMLQIEERKSVFRKLWRFFC